MKATTLTDISAHPTRTDDLNDILADAFALFSRGVADRRSAFRTPTIASIGSDNTPRIRTMVLRRFDAMNRRLTLHTDQRAGKLADIMHTPNLALHVYDARAALQIRLAATAQVHIEDEVARAAWAASAPISRACYAIEAAPGTAVAAPPSAPSDKESGFKNFAALVLRFHRLEWLWLHHSGHRRAAFTWGVDDALHATWLVP
ncbi:MAG: pyridoxamine 5'-phosphate oxidase family protein [Acidocella sp.]|nr:pyridoxamine 5'-phosphate oxidase family protein [Acidocella sp.]